jgi:1-acyl-sn-glycerol-3-phosphate acyltransferase
MGSFRNNNDKPAGAFKPGLGEIIWHTFVRIVLTGTICTLCRVCAYGMKNVPKDGPVLLLSNHQSFLDPIFSQSWIYRGLHFVARESLYENKIFGFLIRYLHTVPIKRGQADLAAMRTIIDRLKCGSAVCLYPEGTRTGDGRIAEIKPGFSLLSRRSGAKIVPVVIEGAFECWPRHKKFPKIAKVVVSYGKPITSERIKELGDREFAKEITAQLRRMQTELRLKLGRNPFDYTQHNNNQNSTELKV